MTSRQLKEEKFKEFQAALLQYARSKPYCPIYETDIRLNDENYILFLQPDKHNRIYVLYALGTDIDKESGDVNYKLVTKGAVLSALMEIVIYQGIGEPAD